MDNNSSQREITFNDILLLPNLSDFPIRDEKKEVDLSTRVTKNITLRLPILSSPMPSITEDAMAIALGRMGGLGILHPFQNFERQLEQVRRVKKENIPVAASISNTTTEGIRRVGELLSQGADLISIESLHAYNTQTMQFIRSLKKEYKNIEILVGLVVTAEAAEALIDAGADGIRVGIGGGSHCTTRLVTGMGRPQLSALNDCYQVTKKHGVPLISDTGIQYPGDIAKAFVYGADCVMIGGLFSGYDETPGEVLWRRGRKYKTTWGICTRTAMRGTKYQYPDESFLKRVFRSLNIFSAQPHARGQEAFYLEEGVEGVVPAKGTIGPYLEMLEGSLQRTMWYAGARNIEDFREKVRVVPVSSNTVIENLPRV